MNVGVETGSGLGLGEHRDIVRAIAPDGVLTADMDIPRRAARAVLIVVPSCRANRSNRGAAALIVGETIGAAHRLAYMATGF
jgi:hypothetical protein